MTKSRACLTHFGISLVVALSVFLVFQLLWYPSPLFAAVGGMAIFLTILACDVVLGPMLTAIVYKPNKKSLRFDLTVIGLLQFIALCYGCYTLWLGRPVYVAALGHRFDLVQYSEISEKNRREARKPVPTFGVEYVGISKPSNPKERELVMWEAISGGGDYGHLPKYHAPIETMAKEILSSAEEIGKLKKLNPGMESAIDAWLQEHGVTEQAVKFQGLKAREKDMAVIVNGTSGQLVGIAPFKPWE